MTKRKTRNSLIFKILTVFILLAVILAGCKAATSEAPTSSPEVEPTSVPPTDVPPPAPTEAPPVAEFKGTLVVALSSEPVTLDPPNTDSGDSIRVGQSMFETLVDFGDEFGVIDKSRGLAEDWTVSDDGLTYTFTLRQGVVFHDGTPFNAEAAKFSIARQVFPDHPYHDIGTWPMGWMLGPISEINVIDEFTLEIVLSSIYAPFLSALAAPGPGAIVSPSAVEEYGEDFGQHPAGTGPFKFVSWEPGVGVTVEAFEDYWGEGPYLEKIVFRPVLEEQTRLTEIKTGQVNLVVDLSGDAAATARDDPELQYIEMAGGHLWWIYLNTRSGPFSDVNVRKAANYAINREEICRDILANTCVPVDTYLPPSLTWSYTDDVTHYPFDLNKAKELMAASSYPDGADVTFWVPNSGSGMQSPVTMAQAIQAYLTEIGLNVEIETFEWGAYLDKVPGGFEDENGERIGDMAAISLFFADSDPDLHFTWGLDSASLPPGNWNVSYYSNPEVDDLLQRARTSLDFDERASYYFEVQRIVSDEAPWINVSSQMTNAVLSPFVKGYVHQPSGEMRFNTISIEE